MINKTKGYYFSNDSLELIEYSDLDLTKLINCELTKKKNQAIAWLSLVAPPYGDKKKEE